MRFGEPERLFAAFVRRMLKPSVYWIPWGFIALENLVR